METKPGYKTTEFWLTVLAILAGLFVAAGFLPAEHVAVKIAGFIVSALATLGYQLGRASVKKASPAIAYSAHTTVDTRNAEEETDAEISAANE